MVVEYMDRAQGPTGDIWPQTFHVTHTKPTKSPYVPLGDTVAVGALSHLCDTYWLTMSELELTQLSVCIVLVRMIMYYHSSNRWFGCSDPHSAVHAAIEPLSAPTATVSPSGTYGDFVGLVCVTWKV